MKKFILFLFLLPVFCFAQSPVTPAFKRKIPIDSLLGYSFPGVSGTFWLPDTAWVKKHAGGSSSAFLPLTFTSNQTVTENGHLAIFKQNGAVGAITIQNTETSDGRATLWFQSSKSGGHFVEEGLFPGGGSIGYGIRNIRTGIDSSIVLGIDLSTNVLTHYDPVVFKNIPNGSLPDSGAAFHGDTLVRVPLATALTFQDGVQNIGGVVTAGGTLSNNIQYLLNNNAFFIRDVTPGSESWYQQASGSITLIGGKSASTTNTGSINVNTTGAAMDYNQYISGVQKANSITIQSGGLTVRDDLNSRGLRNSANWDLNFVANSLVTKRYTDSTAKAKGDSIKATISTGSVPNALTFNNSGSGDASGSTFNGSAPKTLSYNSIGAAPAAGNSSITTIGTLVAGSVPYSLLSGTVPTWNQNTTGSAAKWTTARNLAGNSVDGSSNVAFTNKFIVQGTTDAGLSGAQFLGSLSTGIVKNTTTTGVLSIAVAGTDYQAPISLTTTGTSGAATFSGGTLNIPQYTGGGTTLTRQNITSGTSATVTGGNYWVWFNPSSTISSYTLTLPASPSDQDVVKVTFGGTVASGNVITTLTISPNSGQTILDASGGGPGSVIAGYTIFYYYTSSTTTWTRDIR